jgi:hypothetical protein
MPSDISTVRRERRGRVLVVRIEREAKRSTCSMTTGPAFGGGLEIALAFEKRPPHWAGH